MESSTGHADAPREPTPGSAPSALVPTPELLALAALPCAICHRPLASNLPLATVPCGDSFHKSCLVSTATPVPVSPSTSDTVLSALGVTVDKPPPSFTCPAGNDVKSHTHLGDPSEFGSDVVLSDVVEKVASLLAPFLGQSVPTANPDSTMPNSHRNGLKRRRASTQSSLDATQDEQSQQQGNEGENGNDDDQSECEPDDSAPASFDASDSNSKPSSDPDSHSQSQDLPAHVSKAPRLHSPASSSTASLVLESPAQPPYSLPYADFEDLLSCPLCYHQLHDPVTLSPCGHTACRPCLLRTLDHSANARQGQFRCFVCRKRLWGSYVAYLTHAPNKALERILGVAFPDQVHARKVQIEQDELNRNDDDDDDDIDQGPPVELHNVPLFVCNLAFPGQRVPLHIFEPRYRLMLRRVTAPGCSRLFGMLHYTRTPGGGTGIPTHGTMLHVDNVEFLPDGRSLVETTGRFVFKLTEDSDVHTGDGGYLVARRAERVVDSEYLGLGDPVPGEVAEVATRLKDTFPHVLQAGEPQHAFVTIGQFVRLCAAATDGFLAVVPPQFRAGARAQIGQAPLERPEWLGYWLTGTLPLPESVQYRVLEEPSPRQRLIMAVQWMDQVRRVDSRGPIGVVAQMVGCNIM